MAGWRRFLFPVLLLGIAGCATKERISEMVVLDFEQQQKVQDAVRTRLERPETAIFLPMSAGRVSQGILVCGNVSSKTVGSDTTGFRAYRGVLAGPTFTLDQYGTDLAASDNVRSTCLAQGVIF